MKVSVIGAGIAGCHISYLLAQHGLDVHLIERREAVATQASGNPAGNIMPIIAAEPTPLSKFTQEAFLYATSWLDNFQKDHAEKFWNKSGVLQLFYSEPRARRYLKALDSQPELQSFLEKLDPAKASALSGIEVSVESLYYRNGGWIDSRMLCEILTHSEKIEKHFSREAATLEKEGEVWRVYDAERKLISSSEILVLANAFEAQKFSQSNWLPFKKVRGQISRLKANRVSEKLRSVLCFDGYFTPADSTGSHVLGGTYDRDDLDPAPRDWEREDLLKRLQTALPVFENEQFNHVGDRVAFRNTTPNHFPLLGALPSSETLDCSGLYICAGMGSRGLTFAPLCASLLKNEILSISQDSKWKNQLDPSRLLI